jgi:[acyl-carrier-protein] S-malonyltransferase
MKVVAMFSGQGAQKVGMGKDLHAHHPEARALIEQADEALPFRLSSVMFDGPVEELTRTSRCQPALFVHGLACLAALRSRIPELEITATAGLSLGEFTAHTAAGTFDFATGLDLVHQRGSFMEEACQAAGGAMAAMIGGEAEVIRQLAEECDIDVANYNAPGQIVVSGSEKGVARAVAEARDHGIRMAKPLVVAGAYHSRLMASAQAQLSPALAAAEIHEPSVPVWCNVDARPVSDAEDIRETLARQVTGSVNWADSMRGLVDGGADLFIEFGPGKVLAGLMGRIEKSATVVTVEDCESLEAAVAALQTG